MAVVGISSLVLPALALASAVLFVLLSPGGVDAAEAAPPPTAGLEFHVGGPRGWRVPDGNTSYGWWANNNRFHVGDRLYFKYAHDSVLVVDRPALDACNATAPLAAFTDGATTVRLDRPGFFCFISGAARRARGSSSASWCTRRRWPRRPGPRRCPDTAEAPARPPALSQRSLPLPASASRWRWPCSFLSSWCASDPIAFIGKLAQYYCYTIVVILG
ncbi:unnamed protein product [Urochloa humidicola]